MKKVIYFATAAVLSLTMVSCGGTNESDEDKIEKELLKEFEEKQEAELDNLEAEIKGSSESIMNEVEENVNSAIETGTEIIEESQEKGAEMIKDIEM